MRVLKVFAELVTMHNYIYMCIYMYIIITFKPKIEGNIVCALRHCTCISDNGLLPVLQLLHVFCRVMQLSGRRVAITKKQKDIKEQLNAPKKYVHIL